ncbi:DNA primase family protein [Singulisphaera acidiphila]|uniref:Phage/plasmid primase, P4 family, C-terminal domain protein n=1 Tax=Singulisphaera acidiphila (strain ATCC BAA-1392 / DSM 18658 / VKM B-2454 / MOB10) TaxID=886293 RepID=L0DAX2_SINAD|nr:phage/plasmid primase, P4 family [Singulisphaera acidiphila]AGA26529.1 phage/plasmid primase, P4 family, C-terminal domain protein [Singulisphaera acidiphila DSM 18658]
MSAKPAVTDIANDPYWVNLEVAGSLHDGFDGRTPVPRVFDPGGEAPQDLSNDAIQNEDRPPSPTPKPHKKKEPALRLPGSADDMTDEWHARRFVDLYGDRLRYCQAWGKWMEYDGRRWRNDQTLASQRLARESVQALRQHVDKNRKSSERDGYVGAVRRAESVRSIIAMLRLAQSDERIVVQPEDFDRDDYVLNCLNGTIDLRTGMLSPHNPADRLTKLAPVSFVPTATCPVWDSFLHRIMAGDQESIDYLQRAAGYALTGDVSGQCLFLLYGQGRNGKTVLLNALLHVLGDYGMTAPNHLLTSAGRQQHSSGLADLDGMRLVAISEPDGGRFDEALVKWLTGGDAIRAHRMHCDSYEFSPSHKFFMSSNHKPEVRESGVAIWRRIRLILFSVTIPPNEEDRTLPEKLRGEASGILSWMVRGCQQWLTMDLSAPDKVRQATMDYREEMDPIGDFIAARCVKGPGERATTLTLHNAYQDWCSQTKVDHACRISSKEFATRLEQKGFVSKKTGGVMVRLGIALKPDNEASERSTA